MPVGPSSKTQVAVTSFALLFVSLLLTAYSTRNPHVGALGRVALTEVSAPVYSLFESLRSGADTVVERYVALVGVQADNEVLRKDLEQLHVEKVAAEELRLENKRLRELLGLSQQVGLTGVSAAVIGSAPTGWVDGIVLNRGLVDGVRPGMSVVSSRGVVGQVISSAPHASNVLLITDHSSGLDALVQDGRARGVVEGLGNQKCALRYVNRESEVKEGDTVVTSGMDRVFPKGLVIGSVISVTQGAGSLFKDVIISPVVDFSRVEEVLVLTAYQGSADTNGGVGQLGQGGQKKK
jgi:rod shape-determining protein MreC